MLKSHYCCRLSDCWLLLSGCDSALAPSLGAYFMPPPRLQPLPLPIQTCPAFPAEENVYRLALLLRDNNLVDSLADLHVAFISSHHKEVRIRVSGRSGQRVPYR